MSTQTTLIGGFAITKCEMAIIKEYMLGLPRKLIAVNLGKSLNTLNTQIRYLFKKLGITKVTELVVWAAKNGFDENRNYTPVKPRGIDAAEIEKHRGIQKSKEDKRRKKRK